MVKDAFVHLHVHTHYSILDSACQIEPLIDCVDNLGMTAVAITDSGVMYGVIDFYNKAIKKEIKPIIGFEANVVECLTDQENVNQSACHLTLLARNLEGYRNLSRLCTAGFLDGFDGIPRIDKGLISKHHEGLIVLSGGYDSEIVRHLLDNRMDEAERVARQYMEICSHDCFFLEAQNDGLPGQDRIIDMLDALSRKTNIPVVATSDVRGLTPEHARTLGILHCLKYGNRFRDDDMEKNFGQRYLRSAEDMRLTFKGHSDWCDRTLDIAEQCMFNLQDLHMDKHGIEQKFHLPIIVSSEGGSPEEVLRQRCIDGLLGRYGEPLPDTVIARYEHELKVIEQMGFSSYFLMIGDIVQYARENGIWIGPGRGSTAGSIIAYAMGITDIDPLKYGLIFERFLNECRDEMPDIDIDYARDRRQEVVDFIFQRFGANQSSQIVTFGRTTFRSAVRDVGRVLGVSSRKIEAILNTIPDILQGRRNKSCLESVMEQSSGLKEFYDKAPQVQELLYLAAEIDGLIRQTGIHAAGVLVSDRPLIDHYGPLAKRGDNTFFQYDMRKIEMLGLCKVDVLGLETLMLLKRAEEVIRQNAGNEIDVNNVSLDDTATYEMLARGDTEGVFQFQSEGFRNLLSSLKPDRFEDLIAAVAMFRPGTMEFIDPYIARKHGREEVVYQHPLMEPILAETFGLIIYQEQAQVVANQLAHFSLSEGDLMRRAMSKKIPEVLQDYRQKFAKQAHDTVGVNVAENIFDSIETCATLLFNKSHSACYALIAYRCAYLKCHFPAEYAEVFYE